MVEAMEGVGVGVGQPGTHTGQKAARVVRGTA